MKALPGNLSPLRIMAAAAVIIVLIGGMRLSSSFLSPALIAIFFAIILSPILRGLRRRGLSTGISMLIMIVGIVVFGAALILVINWSLSRLAADMAGYEVALQDSLDNLRAQLSAAGFGDTIVEAIDPTNLLQSLAGIFASLAGLLATMFWILVTILFALAEAVSLPKRLQEEYGAQNPVLQRAASVGDSVVRYFFIRTQINLATGLVFGVWLWIVGVEMAVFWGILAFFLSYIPYLGLWVATILPAVIAFITLGPLATLLVIVGMLVINVLAENLFAPTLMGKGLTLSPLVVFVGFFFWTWVLGIPGMLLAMPLTVLAKYFFESFDSTRWLGILLGPPIGGADEEAVVTAE